MNLKQVLTGTMGQDFVVQQKFDQMLRDWGEKKEQGRHGIHASSIVAPDNEFCYRELVLSLFYEKRKLRIPPNVLRIFLHGWYCHIKWQTLFKEQGIAVDVEQQRISRRWMGVTLTPDAVVEIYGKKYVVEIKTMNTYGFSKLKKPPQNAVNQANFYMFHTGIPRAIVLVEDKNNQDIKVFVIKYDYDHARKYIVRLSNLQKLVSIFKKQKKLPKRICESSRTKRAERCPYAHVCFANKSEREEYRLKRTD